MLKKDKERSEKMEEKNKELLDTISKEETIKLKLTEVLKETTRLCAEFRLNSNSEAYENEELNNILKKGAEDLKDFNKSLALYISKI